MNHMQQTSCSEIVWVRAATLDPIKGAGVLFACATYTGSPNQRRTDILASVHESRLISPLLSAAGSQHVQSVPRLHREAPLPGLVMGASHRAAEVHTPPLLVHFRVARHAA